MSRCVRFLYQVCPKTDIDPTKASALNVVNIGGVFVVSLRTLATCCSILCRFCCAAFPLLCLSLSQSSAGKRRYSPPAMAFLFVLCVDKNAVSLWCHHASQVKCYILESKTWSWNVQDALLPETSENSRSRQFS